MYYFFSCLASPFVVFLLLFIQRSSAGLVAPRIVPNNEAVAVEARDPVAVCEGVLIALKASAFCSTFISLHDTTLTVTSTGSSTATTSTVAASPCTTTLPASTITATSTVLLPTVTSTITTTETTTLTPVTSTTTTTETDTETTSVTTVTVYPTSPSSNKRKRQAPWNDARDANKPKTTTTTTTRRSTTTTTKRPTTTTTTTSISTTSCALKGVPTQLDIFLCPIISSACSLYIHPHTTTVTTSVPGPTSTYLTTAVPICDTATPSPSTTVTSITITPPVSSTTTTLTDTITPGPVTTTITSTTTTSIEATTTVTGTPFGTNDCNNGATAPAAFEGTWNFACGQTLTELFEVSSSTENSFSDCYNSCVSYGACDAFTYDIGTGFCFLSDGAYRGPVTNGEFDCGYISF